MTDDAPIELDPLDLALLEELRRDGRATHEALSQKLGLSRPATRARALRLLDSGAVNILAVVHPSVFGLNAYAHIAVTVTGPALPIAEKLAAMTDTAFVSLINGAHSLVAELRSSDQAALAMTVAGVSALPGVQRVETAVYTSILKDTFFPPRAHQSGTIVDDTDRALLAALQRDGRASFSDLARTAGLSTSGARTRVLRLLETGIVHVGARAHPGALGYAQIVGADLTFDGDPGPTLEAIRRMPQADYLATCLGRCDAVCTFAATSPSDVLNHLDALRALPAVRTVHSWTHLRLLKEQSTATL